MKMKKILCVSLALLMLLALISCGASKAEADNAYRDKADLYYEAPMEDSKYKDLNGSVSESLFDGASGAGKVEAESGDFEEKLIVTVTLRAQTKEYEKALEQVRGTLSSLGGYEESFSSNGRSYGSSSSYCRSARLTVRIPSESLDAFLSEVGELVNVVNEQIGRVNATEEYYDLASRVRVLEEERAAYETMLGKAVSVEEVLLIKDRLYNVISEIESAQTRMKVIDSRASYSTVHLTLEEVVDYSVVTTPKTTFGSRIANAFTRSWKNFAEGFQDFTVWLIGAIPTILLLAVIGAGVAAVAIVSNRRLKKRLNKKDEE
jgi:hypothetical protein